MKSIMQIYQKVLFLLLPMLFIFKSSAAQELSDYRWENRILLIMDAEKDIPSRQKQINLLKREQVELTERDLLVFVFTGDSLLTSEGKPVKMKLKDIPEKSYQGVILIGKDGGEKYRKEFPVDPKLIFERIDVMPMRRAEIRAGGKPH
ncbi:MAG: DUF4174 domain-containing protein [Bacteroidota bacterium]